MSDELNCVVVNLKKEHLCHWSLNRIFMVLAKINHYKYAQISYNKSKTYIFILPYKCNVQTHKIIGHNLPCSLDNFN